MRLLLIMEGVAISCHFSILIMCDNMISRLGTSLGGTRLKVLFCHCKRQSFRQHQKKILKMSKIDKRISTFEISLFDFEKYCQAQVQVPKPNVQLSP